MWQSFQSLEFHEGECHGFEELEMWMHSTALNGPFLMELQKTFVKTHAYTVMSCNLLHRRVEEYIHIFRLPVSCCSINIKEEMIYSRLTKRTNTLFIVFVLLCVLYAFLLLFVITRTYCIFLSLTLGKLSLLHFCLPHYSASLLSPNLFKNKENKWEGKGCKMFLQSLSCFALAISPAPAVRK